MKDTFHKLRLNSITGTDAERAAVRNAVRQAAYGGGRRNEEKWKLYLAKKKETLHIKLKVRKH